MGKKEGQMTIWLTTIFQEEVKKAEASVVTLQEVSEHWAAQALSGLPKSWKALVSMPAKRATLYDEAL